ncbi:MAG: SCO family protein [Deltaproteobacteria bacterium]|nr:SCO family protein [Deltaproteobacteria bacterium]
MRHPSGGPKRLLVLLAVLLTAPAADAQDGRPAILRDVGIEPRLGRAVPMNVPLNEAGRTLELRRIVRGRPSILALVYYRCPMLCGQVLSGLVSGLGLVTLDAGADFEVVVVSIDPRESSRLAAERRKALFPPARAREARGWHFLTAQKASIDRLADAVGFRYAYDARNDQFAHAAAVFVLTPSGRLSRALYGIEYAPLDLRLSLVEASAGRVGSVVDQVLLYCFHYEPEKGRYGATIMGILRLGALATLFGVVFLIFRLHRPSRGGA